MSEPIRVGVLGARGRMGGTVVDAVQSASDMVLTCGLDLGDSLETLVTTDTQIVVDFTTPEAVMDDIAFALGHGIGCVVGTSGFTPERIDVVRALVSEHPSCGVLIAPNFGVGAVLMKRLAEIAAPYFESVEIIELHHPDKVDAPSGTALHTAAAVARARRGMAPAPDKTRVEDRDARGRNVDGVPVHSVRLRGLIAHQEVMFGSAGETLTIRHDSLDRTSFMPGVLLAIRAMVHRNGLVVGLESLLD